MFEASVFYLCKCSAFANRIRLQHLADLARSSCCWAAVNLRACPAEIIQLKSIISDLRWTDGRMDGRLATLASRREFAPGRH